MLVLRGHRRTRLGVSSVAHCLDPARDLLGYERKDDLMSTSATCNIRVDLALALADVMRAAGAATRPAIPMPECDEPVRPHRGPVPHFEHLERNPGCPLSG